MRAPARSARAVAASVVMLLGVGLIPVATGAAAGPGDPITMSLDPSMDLVDGQPIRITGTGPAFEQLIVGQCRPEPLACDTSGPTSTAIITKVGDDGTIHVETTARAILHTPDGDIDCTTAPGTCVLRAGVGSPPVVTDFPLSFRVAVVAQPRLTG